MLALIILTGWVAGVLVNYISDVLPNYRRLIYPVCPNCGHRYTLGNYFIYPRRCQQCRKSRSKRSWLVEIASPLFAVYIWFNGPTNLGTGISLVLFTYFLLVIVIDIEHHLILHPISLVGVAIGMIFGSKLHGLGETITGGLMGFGIMYLFYLIGIIFTRFVHRWRSSDNQEEALGFGDVILAGVLGLILGWPGILMGLIIAILLGGVFSFAFVLISVFAGRYRAFSFIPYGPFLVIGSAVLIFFKEYIIRIIMP